MSESRPRPATEADMRRPELRTADPADYEVRSDGVPVRRDRWEKGIRSIKGIVRMHGEFEVEDVVDAVRLRLGQEWEDAGEFSRDHYDEDKTFMVEVEDGSVLRGVVHEDGAWSWHGTVRDDVVRFATEPFVRDPFLARLGRRARILLDRETAGPDRGIRIVVAVDRGRVVVLRSSERGSTFADSCSTPDELRALVAAGVGQDARMPDDDPDLVVRRRVTSRWASLRGTPLDIAVHLAFDGHLLIGLAGERRDTLVLATFVPEGAGASTTFVCAMPLAEVA